LPEQRDVGGSRRRAVAVEFMTIEHLILHIRSPEAGSSVG
jgi:hypothetical protein